MSFSRLHSIPRFALPYTAGDFTAGLRAIFQAEPPPDTFGFLGHGPKFWTRSGRQALWLVLKALGLRAGSGVALPLFTDPSLCRTIAAAGYRPVFIDIDPRFLTIDPQRLREARGTFSAVVAVHLFGQLADMPAIVGAAGDAAVVEDSAHAPLSFWNGRLAGSFGAASFYSFASTKYWPAGGGGLAVLNDPLLVPSLATAMRLLEPHTRIEELRNVLLQGAKAMVFRPALYGIVGRPLRRWAEKWALLEPCLDQHAIQRAWASVARRQALRMPHRVERQRANSIRLLARLGNPEEIVLPAERGGTQYNYHLFPVVLRSREERAAVMRAMWARFVDTSMIYSGVVKEARRLGYQGGCPVAESVADRLITLPNFSALSAGDVDYVAETFLTSLQACRGAEFDTAPHVRLDPAGSSVAAD